jgi:hypothetical protein
MFAATHALSHAPIRASAAQAGLAPSPRTQTLPILRSSDRRTPVEPFASEVTTRPVRGRAPRPFQAHAARTWYTDRITQPAYQAPRTVMVASCRSSLPLPDK